MPENNKVLTYQRDLGGLDVSKEMFVVYFLL